MVSVSVPRRRGWGNFVYNARRPRTISIAGGGLGAPFFVEQLRGSRCPIVHQDEAWQSSERLRLPVVF